MTVIPLPSAAVPIEVSKALADDLLDEDDRVALRQLIATDDDERSEAMMFLGGASLVETADPDLEHFELVMGRRRRLLPALVALAERREGLERFTLLHLSAHLELARLVDDDDPPPGLESAWPDAQATARRLVAEQLAEAMEEGAADPLLLCLAVFHGSIGAATAMIAAAEGMLSGEDDSDDDD